MCHPVLAEAQALPPCDRAKYREFQDRWAALFDQAGRKEVARAVVRYATRPEP